VEIQLPWVVTPGKQTKSLYCKEDEITNLFKVNHEKAKTKISNKEPVNKSLERVEQLKEALDQNWVLTKQN
jgi:hypothetical protein